MRKPAFNIRNRGGFSLMEVMVVLAVLTILLGISLPSLLAYNKNAREIDRKKL